MALSEKKILAQGARIVRQTEQPSPTRRGGRIVGGNPQRLRPGRVSEPPKTGRPRRGAALAAARKKASKKRRPQIMGRAWNEGLLFQVKIVEGGGWHPLPQRFPLLGKVEREEARLQLRPCKTEGLQGHRARRIGRGGGETARARERLRAAR